MAACLSLQHSTWTATSTSTSQRRRAQRVPLDWSGHPWPSCSPLPSRSASNLSPTLSRFVRAPACPPWCLCVCVCVCVLWHSLLLFEVAGHAAASRPLGYWLASDGNDGSHGPCVRVFVRVSRGGGLIGTCLFARCAGVYGQVGAAGDDARAISAQPAALQRLAAAHLRPRHGTRHLRFPFASCRCPVDLNLSLPCTPSCLRPRGLVWYLGQA